MESLTEILKMPFIWGLALGLLFFTLSFVSGWKVRREFARYRKMLSDKMELESENLAKVQAGRKELEKEAENLRMKVTQLQERPESKLGRELEILARAEKSLMINAPGFAPAWETAKARAAEELAAEESGKSLPQRLFRRFFGHGATGEKEGQVEMLPETAGVSAQSNGASVEGRDTQTAH
jgi:hypothetical protein